MSERKENREIRRKDDLEGLSKGAPVEVYFNCVLDDDKSSSDSTKGIFLNRNGERFWVGCKTSGTKNDDFKISEYSIDDDCFEGEIVFIGELSGPKRSLPRNYRDLLTKSASYS
tara:strand:+ start:4051 stop:4392 length:342 start_codon:yes stop_codon:yes gene_type:complete